MSDITHSDELVTKQDLADFYQGILPYLGGMPEAIANKFSKSDIYSTSEKMIGQWTDGKPIYQKTVVSTVPNCTTDGTEVSSTISIGASVSSIVNIFGTVNFGDSIAIFNVVGGSVVATYKISRVTVTASTNNASTDKNKIKIVNTLKAFSAYPITITIQYTKTTDSAVNMGDENDYSTTEKIIGTWIDGKPLYQKTFSGTFSQSSSTEQYIATGLTIDTVVDIKAIAKSTGGQFRTLPYVINETASDTNRITVGVNNNSSSSNPNKIRYLNTVWSGGSYWITLQYTKV